MTKIDGGDDDNADDNGDDDEADVVLENLEI